MKSEEKARELITRMFYSIVDKKNDRTMRLYYDEAKQCALICVDEILKPLYEAYEKFDQTERFSYSNHILTKIKLYEKVKSIIQEL